MIIYRIAKTEGAELAEKLYQQRLDDIAQTTWISKVKQLERDRIRELEPHEEIPRKITTPHEVKLREHPKHIPQPLSNNVIKFIINALEKSIPVKEIMSAVKMQFNIDIKPNDIYKYMHSEDLKFKPYPTSLYPHSFSHSWYKRSQVSK